MRLRRSRARRRGQTYHDVHCDVADVVGPEQAAQSRFGSLSHARTCLSHDPLSPPRSELLCSLCVRGRRKSTCSKFAPSISEIQPRMDISDGGRGTNHMALATNSPGAGRCALLIPRTPRRLHPTAPPLPSPTSNASWPACAAFLDPATPDQIAPLRHAIPDFDSSRQIRPIHSCTSATPLYRPLNTLRLILGRPEDATALPPTPTT